MSILNDPVAIESRLNALVENALVENAEEENAAT
jgi:hypothetical protein